MVELDQFKADLLATKEPLKEVGDSLDLVGKRNRIAELEKNMEEPGFWDDADRAAKIMQNLKGLKDTVEKVESLNSSYDDIEVLIDMAYEENDASLIPEIDGELTAYKEALEELRITTLLSGPYDKSNAILTLHAGAGGTESCDWAGMLYRMYLKWADKHNLLPKSIIDASPFHCSLVFTNLASIRTNHIFHHCYDFGTTSMVLAAGNPRDVPHQRGGQVVLERCLPIGMVMDERICSGAHYARFFNDMKRFLEHPELLEIPPEEILFDEGNEYHVPKP